MSIVAIVALAFYFASAIYAAFVEKGVSSTYLAVMSIATIAVLGLIVT